MALVGFMGCGKSTIGRKLARRLGCNFVDTDDLVVAQHGSIAEIFGNEGEAAFRRYERAAVRTALQDAATRVIALGGGALTVASNRTLLERHAHRIFIKASPEQIVARLRRSREVRPLLGATPSLGHVKELYQRRMPQYLAVDYVLETKELEARGIIEAIVAWLRTRGLGAAER